MARLARDVMVSVVGVGNPVPGAVGNRAPGVQLRIPGPARVVGQVRRDNPLERFRAQLRLEKFGKG